jgi:hypothetical protein
MIKRDYKFNFLILFEKLLDVAAWLAFPRLETRKAKNKFCFIHRILDFLHDVIFKNNIEVFLVFSKKSCKFHSIGVLDKNPHTLKKF